MSKGNSLKKGHNFQYMELEKLDSHEQKTKRIKIYKQQDLSGDAM
jgi:hypothetical protein